MAKKPSILFCTCSHSHCRGAGGRCKTEKECYYVARITSNGTISHEVFGCADKTLICSDFLNYTADPSMPLGEHLIRRCCSQKNCVLQLRNETQRLANDRRSVKQIPKGGEQSKELSSYNPTLPIVASAVFGFIFLVIALYVVYQLKIRRVLLNADSDDTIKEETEMLEPRPREIFKILKERTAGDDIEINEEKNILLGGGSFGKVYLAEYKSQKVAVKVFEYHAFKWFKREQKIYNYAFMNHDLILRYIFADNKIIGCRNTYIIVTDYCEMGSLFKLLHGGETFGVEKGLSLCSDLVNGIDYLHSGLESRYSHRPAIAHRDLKSSNVLVKKTGERSYSLVIGDFGFAITDRHLPILESETSISSVASQLLNEISPATTSSNVERNGPNKGHANIAVNFEKPKIESSIGFSIDTIIVGTLRYIPPEIFLHTIQCRSFEAFKQADIYSLSLILWEIRSRILLNNQNVEAYTMPYEQEAEFERNRVKAANAALEIRNLKNGLFPFATNQKMQTIVEQQAEELQEEQGGLRVDFVLPPANGPQPLPSKKNQPCEESSRIIFNYRRYIKKAVSEEKVRPNFPPNQKNKYLIRLEKLIAQCWLPEPEARPLSAYCKKEVKDILNEYRSTVTQLNIESSSSLNQTT